MLLTFLAVGPGVGFARGFLEAGQDATAANIDYDTDKSTAILTGNAVVIQEGRGEFRGERIVYNTESGELTGEGAPGGGITMKMQPKAKPAAKEPQK